MLVESSGIFSNFGAEKPPLLQAAGRWWLPQKPDFTFTEQNHNLKSNIL